MTVRFDLSRDVVQRGYVDLEVASMADAREAIEQLKRIDGLGVLSPVWTQDTQVGPVRVLQAREVR